MRNVAIIGGGLSGLAAADILHRSGVSVTVYEARIRFGGRVLSRPALGGTARYDLGPSWIWPQNARMLALATRFGGRVFDQPTEGNLVFQDQAGAVRRDLTMATMGGALRLNGGVQILTDGLRATLPTKAMKVNTQIKGIQDMGDHIEIAGQHGAEMFYERFASVIVAVPPRVVARDIALGWNGGQHVAAHLAAIPTWMAGHAKLIAVYDTPFWRAMGLNGDAISHSGPLSEIHDASPMDASQGALFGFLTVGAAWHPDQVTQAALSQLSELFGEEAAAPRDVLYQNWSVEGETAAQEDLAPLDGHPDYGMPDALYGYVPPRVHFAGAELAPSDGGFLEGALASAEQAAQAALGALGQTYGWS
ncbi:MAG: FAD-dependent oxidoreductase [Rhodobacteraceae bacterium]|nr:FAD-dependent oxidoreductase [Paracoccaceae bacterium]